MIDTWDSNVGVPCVIVGIFNVNTQLPIKITPINNPGQPHRQYPSEKRIATPSPGATTHRTHYTNLMKMESIMTKKQATTDTNKTRVVIFSYYPLLDATTYGQSPGDTIELSDKTGRSPFDQIMEDLENKLPDGRATGCLWMLDDQSPDKSPQPVLIIPRAAEIAKHFHTWCEGEVTEWFKLYIAWDEADPKRYGIVLMPDFEMSIRRWQTARILYHSEMPADLVKGDTIYNIIFSPIHFGTAGAMAFQSVIPHLSPEISVFLIDESLLDGDKPIAEQLLKIKEEDRHLLGKFPCPAEQRGNAPLRSEKSGAYMREFLCNLRAPDVKGTHQNFRGWVNPDLIK